MTDEGFSLQDVIRGRQSGAFVGRTDSLRAFEQNLSLPLDDPRRRFIFTLYGDAGIGKTSLVRQWERVARSREYVTGYVDEAAVDVPSAIELLARGLAEGKADCPDFTDKLKQYRKHRLTVDSDPGAPSGISSLLTRSAVRIGLRATEQIPGVGAFTGEIDKEAAALQADQARAFLARRFTRHQDIELLLSPVDVLTAAFVGDLRAIGERHPIGLFIDTFERTGQFLNDWLLELLEGRHGNLPANIVFTISGQRPLDANLWADYLGIRTDIGLDVFTPDEARQLLTARGVDDSATVELILKLSGRLPVLVATLAESSAVHGTAELGDPSETAVDRFLKWEPDPRRHAAALSGALPRRIDREVLAVAGCGPDDFDWLRRLPFVVSHTDGYRYHDVVRTPMLRSIRRDAPEEWTARHHALAAHYEARRRALNLSDRESRKDNRWRDLKLEEEYHKLCATGSPSLPSALSSLVEGYGRADSVARWTEMITQAGQDTGLEDIRIRGEQLTRWLRGGPDGELLLLSSLAADRTLDDEHRGGALAERSQVHEQLGDAAAALKDLDKADALRPGVYWIIGWRGDVHSNLGNYQQALADLDRAIELFPEYEWALTARSSVHQTLRQYDAALDDINRALEIDPADPWHFANRGSIYQDMERYDEARADYGRALELHPSVAWFHAARGSLLHDLKQYAEALVDLNRALAIDPEYTWALTERANLYRTLKRYPEAIADVSRALALDPKDRWALSVRTLTHLAADNIEQELADMSSQIAADPDNPYLLGRRGDLFRDTERFDEALTDLDRATELDPDDWWALGTRGQVYQSLGRIPEALGDLDRAIALAPRITWMLISRAELLRDLGRYQEAVADLDLAIEIEPTSAQAYATRGTAYHDSGDLDRAMTEFDRASAIDPDYSWPPARRGLIHRLQGRYDQALADLNRAVEIDPDYAWATQQRGLVFVRMRNNAAAQLDFDRAVQLDPEDSTTVGLRGELHRRMGQYEQALRDFSRVIEVAPGDEWGWIGRGQTYQVMGDHPAALADFGQALAIDPTDDWSFYRRALSLRQLGQSAPAEEMLRAAIGAQEHPSIDLDSDAQGAFNRVLYLTALGDREAAQQQLDAVLASQPLADLVQEVIDDLTELGGFIGTDKVGPLIQPLIT
ncbi:tetratricopeptide repeat protein [Kribbella sp. NBC_00709]|uniref:tetratricopeptide repeat protein n=1 Tax=Kribbella sp. NBC_00709 TaxID=2975972 RepID=UPI002E2B8DB2|nr:tetratricopeptide repeat protein [Kribbella sp. NBC_00709]